jgi:excisionase family DNA binding protein
MTIDPEYLTCRETAKMLKVSEQYVRDMLTRKRLRRFKCGARTLILKSEALGLVRERSTPVEIK